MRRLGTATCLLLLACHRPLTQPVDPAKLSAAPSPLKLPDAYVGQTVSGTVTVSNASLGARSLDTSMTAPFTAEPLTLEIPGGGTASATVHFTATTAGAFTGTLTLGPLTVPVQVNALAIPDCPATACTTAHFDLTTGQCTSTSLADGAACHTACVDGACTAGACKGTTTQSCDDGDACTVDACNDNTGCFHVPLTCPEDPAHCQSAVCDPTAGCMTSEAVDGTLCGADDCLSTQVDVCIAGACVQRTRPPTGRCTNTWVPAYLAPRSETAVAYDAARKRIVLFGGVDAITHAALDDTWEYDGTTWTYRTPASSPPPRYWHAMAYDSLRQRTVLFGGHGAGYSEFQNDTWEYDGTTWVQRVTQNIPAARYGHGLVYDGARARVVLYGGGVDAMPPFDDTWEFDGTSWVQRTPAMTPGGPNEIAMAYDAVRSRTVLITAQQHDVWEWDGTTWSSHLPATDPGGRFGPGIAWDPVRQRVLLVGGLAGGHPQFDTWAWDGANWIQLAPATEPPGVGELALAYDSTRQQLVATGADNASRMGTWELDAQAWHDNTANNPSGLIGPALAYDDARQRVVMFGGYSMYVGHSADTWEWDGSVWSLRTPEHSPPGRSGAGFAWNPMLGCGVLFGGSDGLSALSDTWLWNGTSWAQFMGAEVTASDATAEAYDATDGLIVAVGDKTYSFDGAWHALSPMGSPSARTTALAYDAARSEVVLFGGQEDPFGFLHNDTWVWDGQTWTQRMPMTTPQERRSHALAYDSDRQRTVLFGGESDIGDPLADMWEWDGGDWAPAMPARSPPPSEGHAMAYDAARHRLMLVGSSGTWLYLP